MEDSSSLPLDDQSDQLNPMNSDIAPASETGHSDDLNQQPFQQQQQAITRPPAPDGHQTGIFLQHFTNSVNRALHKQNCTCHGKSYTADELFSKSNIALCGGGNTTVKPNATVRKKRHVTLPPIDDLNLSDNSPPNITAAPLKNRLDREVTYSHDLSVGHSSPSSQLTTTKEELRLPRIMNIRDTNGNTWKILQESRDGRNHHHHGRGKLIKKPPKRFDQTNESDDGEEDLQPRPQSIQVKIPTDEALELDAEHQENNGEQGKNEEASDAVIATVSKANTPMNMMKAPVESKDIVKLYNDARARDPHPTSTQILDPDFDAPIFDLAPVCTLAQIKGTKSKCANAYHDDFERKALLLKHNSDVRSRKTSHVEYLRLVSQMTLCPCLRGINFYGEELNRDVMSKQQRRRRNSDSPPASPEKRVLTAMSGLTFKSRSLGPPLESALSFADSSRPVIYARKNYFPGELDNLYTRDGYKTATLQLNGSEQLPSNFLDKEREALRLMYPMYDWKVQQALNSMMRSSGEDTPRKVTTRKDTTHPTPANTATSHKPSVPAKAHLELNSKNHLQKEQFFEPDSVYQQHGHPEAVIGFAGASSSFVLKQVSQENDPSRKSRVIPNQPPTTPAVSTGGFSIILTSTSAPELLTIVESEVHEDKDVVDEDKDVVDENNNPAVDDVETASKQTKSITFGDGPPQDNASVTLEVEQNAESQQQNVRNDPGQQTGRQSQSILNVSPASSATNSAIHRPDNMNVTTYHTNTSGQFRQPSVKCLQIDANVAVRRRVQRPRVVGTGENQTGKTMGRHQNLATDTKSAQTVTKMSTQKVVFVTPAAT